MGAVSSKREQEPRHRKKAARTTIIALAAVLILAAAYGGWRVARRPSAPMTARGDAARPSPAQAETKPEFQRLRGRWMRPDGGYVIEVRSVAPDGTMSAGYFNPQSIRVAQARASMEGSAVKVYIELRDVNYPGSTYALTYNTAADRLEGVYYQAVLRQRFDVVFERLGK